MKLTLVACFNDLASVERLLDEHPGQVAGMIIEPIMMNAGIIEPEPGYLAGLKDLLHSRGALLTFDEVKTGLTAGPSGATGLTGVTPDIICLAKAIGGGVAIAAIPLAAGAWVQFGPEYVDRIPPADPIISGSLDGERYWVVDGRDDPRCPNSPSGVELIVEENNLVGQEWNTTGAVFGYYSEDGCVTGGRAAVA